MKSREHRRTFAALMVLVLGALPVLANNMTVRHPAVAAIDSVAQQAFVMVDLGWENSWRYDSTEGAGDAFFHDAAWVFVKFRPEGSNNWEHAILSTNSADHVPAMAGSACEIIATDDGMGVFVRRAAVGDGTMDARRLRLRWDFGENGYAFNPGDPMEIAVHAIEMVYVAETNFYLGCGGTTSTVNGSFTDGAWTSGATLPFLVTSEAAITVTNTAGNLWGTSTSLDSNIGGAGTLPADYPKGFRAFYSMKYHITQGQYAAFLNSLTATQANAKKSNPGINRHTISGDYPNFTAGAPDRACNYLAWSNGVSYADWAGLRPMTELEFEKAARGPETPVASEYAWGTASNWVRQTDHVGVDGSGTETASPTTANINAYVIGGAIYYAVRVGIYATPTSTRIGANASYWGILEMSGNVLDRVVTVGNAGGRAFTGLHGNGVLTAAGAADVANWPSGANGTGHGKRGGDSQSSNSSKRHRVSDRTQAVRNETAANAPYRGFRGVRSAQ